MGDVQSNRCKEALAHTVIHLHCGCVMPNHVSNNLRRYKREGGEAIWVGSGTIPMRHQPLQAWQHIDDMIVILGIHGTATK